MDHSSSITTWIEKVKEGDPESAQKLWERYCRELVQLARKRVAVSRLPASDDETIVQQAFEAFFRAARAGRLTLLQDRHDLWRLLVLTTESKARELNLQDAAGQAPTLSGPDQLESGASAEDSTQARLRVDEPSGPTPTPEFAALAVDQMRRLLTLLNDTQLTRIAVMRMAGHSYEEIAQRVGCVPDTVDRKLRLIHNAWLQEMGSP